MAHPRTRRDVAADLRVERHEAHAVRLLEHQIRKTGGELRGVFEFAHASIGCARAVVHRAAAIEDDGGAEVRLLLVFADVVAVAACEDAPVNVPDFVAGHVLPVLLEFDAEALVRRPVQARGEALDDLPREHLEVRRRGPQG